MKTLLFLSIIMMPAFSADFNKQVWSKGFEHFVFSYQESTNLLVSLHCLNEDVNLQNSPCEAVKILKNKKSLTLPRGASSGGKNPGAVVCKTALNKNILILKDSKNNENSFCVFDDGSMISAITLQSLIKD